MTYIPHSITNEPHKLFSRSDADRIAAEMQAGDGDGWIYTAIHAPTETGLSFIEVHEADGSFVARV